LRQKEFASMNQNTLKNLFSNKFSFEEVCVTSRQDVQ
jgi:hypothetical protein